MSRGGRQSTSHSSSVRFPPSLPACCHQRLPRDLLSLPGNQETPWLGLSLENPLGSGYSPLLCLEKGFVVSQTLGGNLTYFISFNLKMFQGKKVSLFPIPDQETEAP